MKMRVLVYTLILSFLPISFTIHGQDEKKENIESIYTKAIDARFDGDLAKSRFLLEKLIEDGVNDEYVSSLLLEVYGEYIMNLMKKKDSKLLQTSYPGIRQNIAKIWDTYPDSETIQNKGLMLAWITGDSTMGKVMSELILEKTPHHTFANFLMGMYLFNPTNYRESERYFQKVAHTPIIPNMEKFIFQSRVYLGDIYLEQKKHQESLKYYQKAEEIISTTDLKAKLAVVETYNWNFDKAIKYFQEVPLPLMTRELFDTYITALLGENTKESITLMNYLLSQNTKNPPFAKAVVQMQLGRTQKALKLVDDAKFIHNEMTWAISYFKKRLYKRFNQTNLINKMDYQLGEFAFNIGKWGFAKKYFQELPRKSDKYGNIAYYLGRLEKNQKSYSKAVELYKEALQAPSNTNQILIYTDLIDMSMTEKDFIQAEKYLTKASEIPNIDKRWLKLMYSYLRFEEGKYKEAEKFVKEIITNHPNNIILNNFMASILMKQQKYDETEIVLTNILQKEPNNIITMNHLAYLYAITGEKLNQALELSLYTVNENSEELVYLDTLAWIYFQRNELDDAQEVFTKIEEILNKKNNYNGLEEIFDHLKKFYQKIGDTNKVLQYSK